MKSRFFRLMPVISIIALFILYPKYTYADSEILSCGFIASDFEMIIEAEKAEIIINNSEYPTDFPTQIINNDFMLTARAVFEGIGSYVEFDSDTNTVTVSHDEDTLILNLNSSAAIFNDKQITLSAPVLMINDRTLVPAKAVMNVLGFETSTDESNTILTIKYPYNCSYSILSNGVLEISGYGKMPEFNYNAKHPWTEYSDIITDIKISEGITHIPDNMFSDCIISKNIFLPSSIEYIGNNIATSSLLDIYYNDNHLNWEKVNNKTNFEKYALIHFIDDYLKYSPESDFDFVNGAITKYIGDSAVVCIPPIINGTQVSVIADKAFENSNVKQVIIPDGVIKIGNNGFYNSDVKRIVLPETIRDIGEKAFYMCRYINELSIPYGVIVLRDFTFCGCNSLKKISLPETLTEIEQFTFKNCDSLEMIDIPNSVSYIGSHAFDSCDSLSNVIIPKTVELIAENAFEDCVSLTHMSIPETQQIVVKTFSSDYNLKSISIPSTVKYIGSGAFYGCYALTDIYYSGSEDDWNSISIDGDNELLYDATIHFNCTDIENYIVYYYSNGGNETMNAESYLKNTAAIITDNIPTRMGYRFLGWSTSKYATMPEYVSGDEYTANKSISLYAIWEAIPQITSILQEYTDYKISVVSVDNLGESGSLCFAQYIDDILLKVEIRNYNGGNELFLVANDTNKIKIMAWDNLNNIMPLCESKTTYIDNVKNSDEESVNIPLTEEPITYVKLTLKKSTNGSISAEYITTSNELNTIKDGSTTVIPINTEIKFTATPNTGYGFLKWTGSNISTLISSPTMTLTATENITIQGIFGGVSSPGRGWS